MNYVKRLDLKPDVYLRISYTSLSRSGYYSLPKLQSRITILMYTCEIMAKKGVFDRYRDDLKTWATDIAIGGILGGNYNEAKQVLGFCEQYGLLNHNEVQKIKSYLFIKKYKLSKLKRLEHFFHNRIVKSKVPAISNIGKIAWQ